MERPLICSMSVLRLGRLYLWKGEQLRCFNLMATPEFVPGRYIEFQ